MDVSIFVMSAMCRQIQRGLPGSAQTSNAGIGSKRFAARLLLQHAQQLRL
jgi:hypothetical protein